MKPDIAIVPGGYVLSWNGIGIKATARRIIDKDEATTAEITVRSSDPRLSGHLHQTRINLLSTRAKKELAHALRAQDDRVDWEAIVESLCFTVLRLHRQGEPLQTIGDKPVPANARYRLWPLCPEGAPTVLFGEGGTGKSFLALLACVLVQTGGTWAGLRAEQGNVLYLDYETSADIQNERVKAICAGLNISPVAILYRYQYHAIADDVEALQEMINENNISFLVIDSLGPACGGDPNDASLTIHMFNALRELRVTAFLVDHIAKSASDDRPTPYGSVYKYNLARSIWQIKSGQRTTEGMVSCGLYHRKANFGPLRPPLGFAMRFINDNDGDGQLAQVEFASYSVFDDADLAHELPLRQRILALLKREGKKTVRQIAESLRAIDETVTEDAVRMALSRGRGTLFVKLGDAWGACELTTETEI